MNMQTNSGVAASKTAILTHPTTPDVQAKWDAIDRIDFTNIKRKLVLAKPEGSGWTEEGAELGVVWYRRYLKLHAKYSDRSLVPSRFIDEVWHLHILDTRAYAKDCQDAFGGMLHHYPYFGMNGDVDQRDNAFEQTDLLYIAEFGESCRDGSKQASMCDGTGEGACDNNAGRETGSMCDGTGEGACDNNAGREIGSV